MKQKRQRPNALPRSLALTAGYLRLRMIMEVVPLSLKTSFEPDNFSSFKINKCTRSCSPSNSISSELNFKHTVANMVLS